MQNKAMGDVHHLIIQHGVEAARAMAATKAERNIIDAAAAIMVEEEARMGITHAGFAMTSLPHKKIDDTVWRRSGPSTTLLIASGHTEEGRAIGVPYGSIARLILLYLQTEAIRTGSAEVDLGRSMNAWLSKMNLAIGGKTYNLVAEQAKRISYCRLTFYFDQPGVKVSENGAFVSSRIEMAKISDDQPTLWQEKVRLDDGFLNSLRKHPVPVREEAIRAIGTRSLAIDIYIWLAYRLAFGIAVESVGRLLEPRPVAFGEATVIAIVGLLVNIISATLLGGGGHHGHGHDHGGHRHAGHQHDNNMRSAYIHVLADALTSVLAIAALLGGRYLGWVWLDPVMGIVGAVVIASWSWTLMRDTAAVLLDASDPHLEEEIRQEVEGPGDARITDLHVWRVGPGAHAAIVSVIGSDRDSVCRRLAPVHEIAHLTVEAR